MRNLILYSFLLLSFVIFAQEKDMNLPKANDEFADKKYAKAEAEYRISLSNNPKKAISSYNLGNSIYKQNHGTEALLSYEKTIKIAAERPEKHKAFHNSGNIYMAEKNYSAAVEAYKNALRNNPSDEETRYNFALAKKMLKDNPPKKNDKKDKKDKKDDKKKDDKKVKKDKKDDKKDKKDKNDNNGNEDGKPKPRPGGIPKERVQNLLDAVNNEEKKIQDKVNAKKVKGKPMQTEKDW
ncbi:MAG: tetratricopeptide repeat protein [Flavobacteriaceae bacterium]|nr:tetratricopeptide repeat protein [Flavobacteriaceae bacterium]